MEKHCVSCHGEKKQKGKLRIDNLSTDFSNLEIAEQWQAILDELNGATMPPEDEPQPTKEELTGILESLTYKIEEAKKLHYGKDRQTVMRRLNKREYINTMYELTGYRFNDKEIISDQSTAKYDNHGEGLFVSSFLLGKYRQYAYKALDEVFSKKIPKAINFESSPAQGYNAGLRKKMSEIKKTNFKKTNNQKRVFNLKPEYDYFKSYLEQPGVDKGVLIDNKQEFQVRISKTNSPLFSGENDYRLKFKGVVKNLKDGAKAYLVLATGKKSKHKRHIDISEGVNGSFDIEVDAYCSITSVLSLGFYTEVNSNGNKKKRKKKKNSFPKLDPKAVKLQLNFVSISYEPQNIADGAFKKIFSENKKSSESEVEYAGKVLRTFALKAYRGQPISDKFIQLLVNLYKSNITHGLSKVESIKEPLAIILSSPKFIYLSEDSSTNSKFISEIELAVRLSYFLWSSPPDKELYNLAYAGKLSDKTTLRSQVVRMLRDESSHSLGKGFLNKWLHMDALDIIEVKNAFEGPKSYSLAVESYLRKEPLEFFRKLALDNLSIINMLDSDFVTVNQTLASYYNLPVKISENEFAAVTLPSNSPRGGLLGMGAILAMNGNGERSSPVLRGNFVLTRMMGMASPPPPPNVPDLEVQTKGNIKEKLLAHQAKPQCASCHKRIDPAGFGLESFDQSGQWLGVNKENKNIVEGKLPSLGQYKNFFEQRQLLLKNKDNFAKAFIENLASYAFARKVGFSDASLIDKLTSKAKSKGYKLQDIICEIVLSDEFRLK